MKHELTWDVIAQRPGVPSVSCWTTEKAWVSLNQRRVGEFDLELLRSASEQNGATQIALTFADYLDVWHCISRRIGAMSPGPPKLAADDGARVPA